MRLSNVTNSVKSALARELTVYLGCYTIVFCILNSIFYFTAGIQYEYLCAQLSYSQIVDFESSLSIHGAQSCYKLFDVIKQQKPISQIVHMNSMPSVNYLSSAVVYSSTFGTEIATWNLLTIDLLAVFLGWFLLEDAIKSISLFYAHAVLYTWLLIYLNFLVVKFFCPGVFNSFCSSLLTGFLASAIVLFGVGHLLLEFIGPCILELLIEQMDSELI